MVIKLPNKANYNALSLLLRDNKKFGNDGPVDFCCNLPFNLSGKLIF